MKFSRFLKFILLFWHLFALFLNKWLLAHNKFLEMNALVTSTYMLSLHLFLGTVILFNQRLNRCLKKTEMWRGGGG